MKKKYQPKGDFNLTSKAIGSKCFNTNTVFEKRLFIKPHLSIQTNDKTQTINQSNNNSLLPLTKSDDIQLCSFCKSMTISEKFQFDLKQIKLINDHSFKRFKRTKRLILTQSKSESKNVNLFNTALLSKSSSSNLICNSIPKKKTRNRVFDVDKDKLIKQSKRFYLTTAISGTFLSKCSQLTQLKQFNSHMEVLFENIKYFQKTFLIKNAFKTAFNNMDSVNFKSK